MNQIVAKLKKILSKNVSGKAAVLNNVKDYIFLHCMLDWRGEICKINYVEPQTKNN